MTQPDTGQPPANEPADGVMAGDAATPQPVSQRRPAFSLRVKMMFFAAGLVVSSAVLSGAAVWWAMAGDLLSRENERLAEAAHDAALQLSAIVGTARQDALMIAGAPATQGLLRAMERGDTNEGFEVARGFWRDRTHDLFESLLMSKPSYSEAVLISSDSTRRELLRVKRKGEDVLPVADGELLARAGRAYVEEALRPGSGPALVSEIDFDRGDGQADTVPRPVFRVAVPLLDSTSQLFALIILTADVGESLSGMQELAPPYAEVRVLNSSGRFLAHPDPAKTDDGTSARRWGIEDEFPGLFAAMGMEPLRRDHRLYQRQGGRQEIVGAHDLMTGAGSSGRRIRFLYTAHYADVRQHALAGYPKVLLASGLAMSIAIPLALLFGTALVTPLRRVTNFITAWKPGTSLTPLPTDRRDEIGALAREFGQLLATLEQRQARLQNEIVERRQAEAERERLTDAVQHAADSIEILDVNGNILYLNPANEKRTGRRLVEVRGTRPEDIMDYSPDARAHKDMLQTMRAGRPWSGTLRSRTSDGTLRVEDVSVSLVRDAHQRVSSYIVVIRDITCAEQVRVESRRLAAALDSTDNRVVITDENGIIWYGNTAFQKLVGLPRADIVGRQVRQLVHAQVGASERPNFLESLKRVQPWRGPMFTTYADGSEHEEQVSVSPVHDPESGVLSWISVRHDVTDQRRLESQLQRAQKLESIGQLAAGIAHEINTPAQYVGDNLRFVQDAFAEFDGLLGRLTAMNGAALSAEVLAEVLGGTDLEFLREEVPRALEQSVDGCQRISGIVKAMKEFSHPGQEKTPVDLNRAIASTITVATNEWKYVAEVHTDFDPQLPPVVCLPGEVNQVVLNMLVNAAHAIADVVGDGSRGKGAITVTTRSHEDWVELRIGDSGTGIRPEVRAKIFDPFFTTKEVGKGTGQGLVIAHDVIVNKHGGTIAVESEMGKGSIFIVRLPVNPRRDAASTTRAA